MSRASALKPSCRWRFIFNSHAVAGFQQLLKLSPPMQFLHLERLAVFIASPAAMFLNRVSSRARMGDSLSCCFCATDLDIGHRLKACREMKSASFLRRTFHPNPAA